MILTFVAPTTRHPIGGVAMIFEFAAGLARRGHEVHVFHASFGLGDEPIDRIEDLTWFTFPEGIHHHVMGSERAAPESIPAADVIFAFAPPSLMPEHAGLPAVFVQGYQMLSDDIERATFHTPCPKVCVASWLVDVGRSMGVPSNELVHVPVGLRHDRYLVLTPPHHRPRQVSFCYNAHLRKGALVAIKVLVEVRRSVPDLEVVAFGNTGLFDAVPDWITYRSNPSQREIIEEIYNRSQVFLCTSEVEGFGLPSVEAMACGAALCTTDNGGSRDYAIHDETALVSAPGDLDAMVGHLTALLCDDDRRVDLASSGRDFVRRFDWERSAEVLERFLEDYVSDPAAYGRPPVPT